MNRRRTMLRIDIDEPLYVQKVAEFVGIEGRAVFDVARDRNERRQRGEAVARFVRWTDTP